MPDAAAGGASLDAAILEALNTLARERKGKSFCPSEAARRVSDDWRPLMPRVRSLAKTAGLKATQRGVPVDARKARGPIRLSR